MPPLTASRVDGEPGQVTRTTESEPHADGAEGRAGVHGGASTGLPVAGPRPLPSGTVHNGAPAYTSELAAGSVAEDAASTEGNGGTGEFSGEIDRAEALTGDEPASLTAILESLLFVSGEALEASQLAKAVGLATAHVRAGLAQLAAEYQQGRRGLRLQVYNDRYQLVTSPAAAAYIEGFLEMEPVTRLSTAALETLAVIAYRQPATRAQVEAVRGVDCAGVLRSLMVRGLIEETGRLEAVGRPILYAVTEYFMQHFGLMELGELPPLPEVDADLLHATTALAGAEAELLLGDAARRGVGPAEVSEASG